MEEGEAVESSGDSLIARLFHVDDILTSVC